MMVGTSPPATIDDLTAADLEALRPTLTRIARIARAMLDVPYADVPLFVEGKLWRASGDEGMEEVTDPASEITMHADEAIWIPDLRADPRFADHPTVREGAMLRFYAGAPIQLESGLRVGALAVYDIAPRALDPRMARRLQDLAALVAQDFDRVRAVRERAAALEASTRSEERLRIALENAGMHVYEMDYVARTLHKAGAEDTFFAVPKTYRDLSKNIWADMHPDDIPASTAEWERCQKTGEPYRFEYRLRHSEGKYVWVSSVAELIQDPSGRPLRLIGALQNINARKLSEEAVHVAKADAENAAERLSFALDSAKAAAWEVDSDAQIMVGGEELSAICGQLVSLQDVLSLTPRIVHPDDRPHLKKFVAALASGERQDVQHRIAQPDGSVRWLHTTGRLMEAGEGRSSRTVFLTTDITERKIIEGEFAAAMARAAAALAGKRSLLEAIARDIGGPRPAGMDTDSSAPDQANDEPTDFRDLYKKLAALLAEIDARDRALTDAVGALRDARTAAEEANIAKSTFLATMSHELRTPLNAVIGYSEILEEDLKYAGNADGAADATRIRRAARNLLKLINEVLDFSKIESGRMELRPSSLDVAGMLEAVVSELQPLAEANKNHVALSVDANVGDVVADEMRLKQCISNLVSNACKFTEHGHVMVAARRDGAMLEIAVTDTGVGIAADQAARLFQPFVQADGTHTRKQDGAGLGLALTRKLAELMGGDVDLKSAPGKGSTFTLRIAAPVPNSEVLDTGAGPIIVVIEDDAGARDIMHRALVRAPFRVRSVASARAGERLVAEAMPVLIVLDIHLPDDLGWRLLERLKADPATRDVPVLVCTVDADRNRALALGACGHLPKPIDRETFVAAVARYARAAGGQTGAAALQAS